MTARQKMTAAQFRSLHGRGKSREHKPRRNKYGAKTVYLDGIRFPSEHEMTCYATLKQRENAGLIANLELQVPIPLMGMSGQLRGESGRPLVLRADFRFLDLETGRQVIADAKGFKTKEYLLKKAILANQGYEILEL